MLLAAALMAGTTMLAKPASGETLGTPLQPSKVSHGRFLFAFLGIATVVAFLRPRLRKGKLRLHGLRSMAGAALLLWRKRHAAKARRRGGRMSACIRRFHS